MEEESAKEERQERRSRGNETQSETIGAGLSLSALFFSITSVMNALHTGTVLPGCSSVT